MKAVVMLSPYEGRCGAEKCREKVTAWTRHGLTFTRLVQKRTGVYEVVFPKGTTKARRRTRRERFYDVYTTPSGVRFMVGSRSRHGYGCLSLLSESTFNRLFNSHNSAGTRSPAYSEYSAAAK
jgi:hypothetical protein